MNSTSSTQQTAQHTPGPWLTEAFDTANGTAEQVFAMIEGTPVEICDVSPDHEDGGVANARLIAAAPELLEALQSLLDLASDPAGQTLTIRQVFGSFPHDKAMIEGKQARAALAKATR